MTNINELMEQVREGMDVYGSDGEKIGEVGDVNIGTRPAQMVTSESTTEERSYFQVTKGFLGLSDEMWIPAKAIAQVTEESVTLRYTSEEVTQHGGGAEPVTPERGSDGGFGFMDLGLRNDR